MTRTPGSGDAVDRVIAAWLAIYPNADLNPLHLVGRIIVLADHLRQSVDDALAEHGLTLGQFDILATLRRHDSDGGMTPGRLLKNVVLSSGGLTNRLDRLERDGLIVRSRDPDDRRGVIVTLTAKGRDVIDHASATRFHEASISQPSLSDKESELLCKLLRKWLLEWEPNAITGPKSDD
jgi:DNA-binding MarR family transcriptional regulator